MFWLCYFIFFFFNDTATTEIYTLSLHDALPIYGRGADVRRNSTASSVVATTRATTPVTRTPRRSEEHTSELQSQSNLVCRLLLEKKKQHALVRGVIPLRCEISVLCLTDCTLA